MTPENPEVDPSSRWEGVRAAQPRTASVLNYSFFDLPLIS